MRKFLFCALSLLVLTGCQVTVQRSAPATAEADTKVDPFWPADGVFPVPGKTSSWAGFRANNAQRRTEFARHRADDENAIVFVGDSITEGWRMLDVDFAGLGHGVKVVNRGIGGDTTPNLIYRLEDDVLSLRPRALVILIGTNDLGEHTSPRLIAGNLDELRTRIRAAYPTIPIAWCLVMPRGGREYPDRIRELNARIAQLAAADPRITICDTFTPMAQPDGSVKPENYVPDELHLNSGGYAVWRSVVYPVVKGWNLGAE